MKDPDPVLWWDGQRLWGCGWCGTVLEIGDPRGGDCCPRMREWCAHVSRVIGLPAEIEETETTEEVSERLRWGRVVRRWARKHLERAADQQASPK